MSIEEKIIKASRRPLMRVQTTSGSVGLEDLWDMKVEELNTIAVDMDAQLEAAGTKSYLKKTTDAARKLQDKRDIVVYILETKVKEAEDRKLAAKRREEREHFLELREKKLAEGQEAMSLEEIDAKLAELKA
jgi:hypothetical protein